MKTELTPRMNLSRPNSRTSHVIFKSRVSMNPSETRTTASYRNSASDKLLGRRALPPQQPTSTPKGAAVLNTTPAISRKQKEYLQILVDRSSYLHDSKGKTIGKSLFGLTSLSKNLNPKTQNTTRDMKKKYYCLGRKMSLHF